MQQDVRISTVCLQPDNSSVTFVLITRIFMFSVMGSLTNTDLTNLVLCSNASSSKWKR